MVLNGHNKLSATPFIFDPNSVLQTLVVTEDSEASLAAILQHSIISSQEQIHAHFNSISSKKGTKILIWNIRRSESNFFLFLAEFYEEGKFHFYVWGIKMNHC